MFYDFHCDGCKLTYEEYQPIDSEHKLVCPKCHKKARRIYSPLPHSFTFKAGWDAGLGKYVDTKKQRETFVREKGLIMPTSAKGYSTKK
jgi:putative FmdB family regulatory protein